MGPQSTLNLASHVTTTCSHVIGQVLVPHGRVFDAGEFPGAHREIVRALPAAPDVGLSPTYAGQSVEAQEVHVTTSSDYLHGGSSGGSSAYSSIGDDQWAVYRKEEARQQDAFASRWPRRAWDADAVVAHGAPRAGPLASRMGT